MKTKIDEVYKDIAGRIISKPNLFTSEPKENIKILATTIETVNIAKCNLIDLDIELPHASLYLMYLLQSKNNVNFGLCPGFKIWYNQEGPRMYCQRKKEGKPCNGLCVDTIRKAQFC